jgi:cohesin complex subunit SCC1
MEEDDDEVPPPPMEDDDMPPPMDDEDMPVPFDDEEPKAPMAANAFDDDVLNKSPDGRRDSSLELGLVNDLEDDIIEEEVDPRQTLGDELVSSNSKWHKHTVKVYKLLKRSMASGQEAEDEEEKPGEISYDSLSKGSSRRTAAGVFFELLQLKTWDFIELDQNESYGDIKISPGVKFGEDPPVSNASVSAAP